MTSELLSQYFSSTYLVVLVSGAVSLILTGWGAAIVKSFPSLALNMSFVAQACLGFLIGHVLFCACAFVGVILGIPVSTTLLAGTVLLGALFWVRRRRQYNAITSPADSATTSLKTEVAALLIVFAGSILWSLENIKGLQISGTGLVVSPWLDILFHAKLISNFSQFDGNMGTLNSSMYGEPLPMYHYGSYMASAVIARLTGAPAFQIATTHYPILGMMLTGSSMFVLARSTSTAVGALIAVALLFFLPDPSSLASGTTRSNSYAFYQQVGIGGAYAVAVMGLALTYSLRSIRTNSYVCAAGALALFAFAGIFKVQVVLAYSAVFTLFVIWSFSSTSVTSRLGASVVFLIAFLASIYVMAFIPKAPTFSISAAGIIGNVNYVAEILSGELPSGLSMVLSFPLTIASSHLLVYGFLAPFAAYLAWTLRREPAARQSILIMLTFLIGHTAVRILIADNTGWGDRAEVNRKTLIWPYFVVTYCVAALAAIVIERKARYTFRLKAAIGAIVVVCALLTMHSSENIQNWAGNEKYRYNPVPQGLFQSAHFLRTHAQRGDVIQLCENDPTNQLATFSERPVFVNLYTIYSAEHSDVQSNRLRTITQIMQAISPSHAHTLLETAKISWFVTSPNCEAPWEKLVRPTFGSEGFRIYKVSEINAPNN